MESNEGVLDRPTTILGNAQLVVHDRPTPEDVEAERLIRAVHEEYVPEGTLEVVRWRGWGELSAGITITEWVDPTSLPALQASFQQYYGLASIRKLAEMERKEWERIRRRSHATG